MNQNQITRWKRQYGKIFKVKIQDTEYVYRLLNIGESSKVLTLINQKNNTLAEDVILNAVIYPKNINWDTVNPGVIRKLTDFILESTGIFSNEGMKKVVADAKAAKESLMADDLFSWKSAIMRVFPGYKLSDLDKMSIDEFFMLSMIAEEFLGMDLIDYGKLNIQNKSDKLPNGIQLNDNGEYEIPVRQGRKGKPEFLSGDELNRIVADISTQKLMEHMRKYRK